MKEIRGNYGVAKVFTDNIEDKAVEQIKVLMNQPYAVDANVRIMPDVHAGAGCTIGTTMYICNERICPNLVGVDIGCGVYVIHLKGVKEIDCEKLDQVIHKYIPSGYEIHSTAMLEDSELNELKCKDSVDLDRAYKSIGTLGGGNHFIEIDKDDQGGYYLVIHSGSRHLGVEVATYYQNKGYDILKQNQKDTRDAFIHAFKAAGREREISAALAKLKNTEINKDLAYVGGDVYFDYIHDIKIVQRYASINRELMAYIIMDKMGWSKEPMIRMDPKQQFHTIHNYIDYDIEWKPILRKGAVSAKKGELLIIPMNMRDGSLICRGKGNPDWNYSAPHGAGRILSRAGAKKEISIADYEKSMSGIYTTSVNEFTLDESPMAYKPMDEIISNISDTVDILKVIKPVYNFKAIW